MGAKHVKEVRGVFFHCYAVCVGIHRSLAAFLPKRKATAGVPFTLQPPPLLAAEADPLVLPELVFFCHCYAACGP